jgi:predicted metalloprotease
LGAQGEDFATAYVIAHEIGHHVQTLGNLQNDKCKKEKKSAEAKLSVALELQADFMLAFEPLQSTNEQFLEEGDIDALSAAHAVGDDAIQPKCKDILFRTLHGTWHNVKHGL